jgi:hypothetical protein
MCKPEHSNPGVTHMHTRTHTHTHAHQFRPKMSALAMMMKALNSSNHWPFVSRAHHSWMRRGREVGGVVAHSAWSWSRKKICDP